MMESSCLHEIFVGLLLERLAGLCWSPFGLTQLGVYTVSVIPSSSAGASLVFVEASPALTMTPSQNQVTAFSSCASFIVGHVWPRIFMGQGT